MTHRTSTAAQVVAPIHSQYRSDPEMLEVLATFVDSMPAKVATLTDLWQRQELEELRRMAHQLKGSGGGYGFPQVGVAAGRLELALNKLAETGGTDPVQELRTELESLISLCQRVAR